MSDAPQLPPWLRDAIITAQRVNEALLRSPLIAPEALANAARALEHYEVVRPALAQALETIRANLPALEHVQQLLGRYRPENWHELQSGELDIVDLVEASGIPVVWVPRAAIVEALIAADRRDRYETLVSSSEEALDDLGTVLAAAQGADVRGHDDACEFAGEAIAAARDGHWNASQALAASGLGQVIHGMFGYPLFRGLGAARKKFSERDIEEATMMTLKVALLEACTVRALTDIADAQPEPFNRHGTQHGDRQFFSQASALTGLLLLVGWIREFAWLAENRRDVLGDAPDDD